MSLFTGFFLSVLCKVKHSMNTAYVLTDLMLSSYPIRIWHLLCTAIFASIYVTFNIIYFLAGGDGADGKHYVYDVLDWHIPAQACVAIILGIILSAVVQIFLYGVYRLRMAIYKNTCGTDGPEDGIQESVTIVDNATTSYDALKNEETEIGKPTYQYY